MLISRASIAPPLNAIWLKACIFILPQLLFAFAFIFTNSLHFATNDDTTMVALAAGGYGNPSQYLINSHIFIGYVTKFLFSYFPIINWLSLIYLVIELLSFVALDIIFIRKNTSISKCIFDSSIIFCCFFIFLTYFTFTTVSFISGIAGVIWCIYYYEKKKKIFIADNIFGAILIISSILVRKDPIVSIALTLIPLLIYKIVVFRDKTIIQLPIFILISFFSFSYINDCISNQSLIQRGYLEWGNSRQKAMDSEIVNYEKHKSEFDSIGFSKAAYLAAYNAFYYSKDTFSKESFEKISKFNSYTERFNFNLGKGIKKIFFKVVHFSYFHFNVFLAFLLWIVLFYSDRRNSIKYTIIIVGPIIMDLVFFIYNRNPYRVVMPNYIFSVFLMLLYSPNLLNSQLTSNLGIKLKAIYASFFLSFLCFFISYQKMSPVPLYDSSVSKVIRYMENHSDELFLAGEPSVFSLDCNRNIFDFAGRKTKWNLIGNWETYSSPYYDLVKGFNVADPDNIVNELPDNKKIKILTAQSIELPDYVLNFISEKTGKKVDKILVDTITDTSFGNWYVYSIVTVN